MDKLINDAMDGDAEAFVALMEQNMQSMYKTAWVYLKNDSDIADAVQDTILACYEKIGTLQNAKYFKTWLTRILINKCKDMLRKRVDYSSIEIVQEKGELDSYYDQCEWKELLNSLDEKYSIVVLMYYFEGMSVKEIGELLHVKKNTVLTRLRRGRKLLAEAYGIKETRTV